MLKIKKNMREFFLILILVTVISCVFIFLGKIIISGAEVSKIHSSIGATFYLKEDTKRSPFVQKVGDVELISVRGDFVLYEDIKTKKRYTTTTSKFLTIYE